VQRLDASGQRLWGDSGFLIGNTNNGISEAAILADSNGGGFFLWESVSGNGNCCAFFAQYVTSDGTPQWGPPMQGIQFTPNATHVIGVNTVQPSMVTDGAGGIFISYLFYQVDPATGHVYTAVQRILANGTLAFPISGIKAAGSDQTRTGRTAMISDEAGGAILILDVSSSNDSADDLIVQRVDGNGNSLWGASGRALVSAPNYQEFPQVTSDGAGGWIVTWAADRNGEGADCERNIGNCDIYAQRIDNDGNSLWQANGVPVTKSVGSQRFPKIVSDGSGGAIIAFHDCRYSTAGGVSCDVDRDVFAQRLDSSGTPLWTADGVAVTTAGWN